MSLSLLKANSAQCFLFIMMWRRTAAHLSLFIKKINEIWKMKIHKLNQIDARNRHLRTNVKLSQCKAIAVSEEKLDKDMISVIS